MGDIITAIDDIAIDSSSALTAALSSNYQAGDTATVTYYRDGEYHTTELTFDEQPLVTDTTKENGSQNQQGGNQNPYGDQYGGQYPGGQYPGGFDMFDLYEYFFGRN